MASDQMNEWRAEMHHATADLACALETQGDLVAQQNGWALLGLDAIRYYLMQKHHWTPEQLFAMSVEHLRFAMSEEVLG
ncbi:hypothetical protein GGR77_001540 [Xanthomonas translucens]